MKSPPWWRTSASSAAGLLAGAGGERLRRLGNLIRLELGLRETCRRVAPLPPRMALTTDRTNRAMNPLIIATTSRQITPTMVSMLRFIAS